MNQEHLIAEILTAGEDDWVYLAAIVRRVDLAMNLSGEELLRASLEVIEKLMAAGWMTPGDVQPTGFISWPISGTEALARIERELRNLGREPKLGEICWFENTPEGDAMARKSGLIRDSIGKSRE